MSKKAEFAPLPGRRKKQQWGKKSAGIRAEKLPAASKLIKEARKEQLKEGTMSMEEKLKALELYSETKDVAMVAAKLNRSELSVRRMLERYMSTTTGAKLTLQAGAEKMARRVVKEANVTESLEVLDRLDVLPKVDRAKKAPNTSFQIIVGMPVPGTVAAPAEIPIPTQKMIEDAIEAEVVTAAAPAQEATSGEG